MFRLHASLRIGLVVRWPGFCAALGCLALATSTARAQHADLLVQSVAGQLTTGTADFDNATYALGQRVFTRSFDNLYAVNDPGFNSLANGSPFMPPGATALPGSADLDWDFLPMAQEGLVSNLLYWNGVGSMVSDVAFAATPTPQYRLSLFGKNNVEAAADGSDQFIPGATIATTGSNGFIHEHRFFFLDDGDGNFGTTPNDGIYLIAMQLRMAGVNSSPPFYLVWGTPGVSPTALESLARQWVEQRQSFLVPSIWNVDAGGDWGQDANWLARLIPDTNQETAILGNKITAPRSITNTQTRTLRTLEFDSPHAYTISGGGWITLQAATGDARLEVQQGEHTIAAGVNLADTTQLIVAADASLLLASTTQLSGHSLTKTGPGTLIWNGSPTSNGGSVQLLDGVLSGVGTIGGNVMNTSGVLSPGPNSLPIAGGVIGGEPIASIVPEPSGYGSVLWIILSGNVGRRRRTRHNPRAP